MAERPDRSPGLGELLELLHGADEPFESVQVTYRIWHHTERAGAAFRAAAEESRRRGAGVSTIHLAGGGSPAPVEQVETMRIWRAGDRVREEVDGGPRNGFYGVRAGERWWHWDERSGALSNEGNPTMGGGTGKRLPVMLNPTPLLGSLRFRPLGHSRVAGRRTIAAEALPRPEGDHGPRSFELHQLGHGADRYTLEVDAERGVLLDVVAHRDGKPFHHVSTLEISFDEPIAEDRFVFVPPPGEEIRRAGLRATPEYLPLTEAQQRAPFTVLMPGHVPADWELRCMFVEPSERPRLPLSVGLHYRSESGHETVHLSQYAVTDYPEQYDLMLAGEHWEEVVRDGAAFRVNTGSARGPGPRQAQACVERGGAFVFLTSDTLSTEQLTRIAAGLVPAPGTSGV